MGDNKKGGKFLFRGEWYYSPQDVVLSSEDAAEMGDSFNSDGIEVIGADLSGIINKAAASCKMAGKELSPEIKAQLNIVNVRIVSWKKLLTDFLSKLHNEYYTYSAINKRYMHMDVRVPGPKKYEENSRKLDRIVLAIDTSGSMFDESELSKIVSIAAGIVKKYKANGEIIYWDTKVTSTATFKDVKELVRTEVSGGGGTDINCLFEYLDKKYPRKNDLPSLVLVMTDGYFGILDNKYIKKYKNVIWAITEHDYSRFKNPNGKKAVIKA